MVRDGVLLLVLERSSEKNTAWRRLFSDLNTVWPTYCSSIKPKVEKYSFMAGMVSACRVGSLLKMEMRKCGANRMTAQADGSFTVQTAKQPDEELAPAA